MEIKLCKDCKWIEVTDNLRTAVCKKEAYKIDLVTGDTKAWFCQVLRETTLPYLCGAEGRWWEPK